MAGTTTRLVTFEEYEKIPNPPGGVYELRHGERFTETYPKNPHIQVQWQLRQLLQAAAGDAGRVYTEFPYRPLPQYECWGADVAYVNNPRWRAIEDWLMGAPELVVEVRSPSNTKSEIAEKRKLCLENGSCEFWAVDTETRQVEVFTPDGRSVIYKSDGRIAPFFDGYIAVDDIFA